MARALFTTIIFCFLYSFPSIGNATVKKYCINIPVNNNVDGLDKSIYPDARNIGSLHNGVRYFKARGMKAKLVLNGSTVPVDGINSTDGYAYLDSSGCATYNTIDVGSGTKSGHIYVKSEGRVGTNNLKIHPRNSETGIYTYSYAVSTNMHQTGNPTFWAGTEFVMPRIYVLYAWMMTRFTGGVSGETLHIGLYQPGDTQYCPGIEDSAACTHSSQWRIQLRRLATGGLDSWTRAYLMAHEYGHFIMTAGAADNGVTNFGNSGDYLYSTPPVPFVSDCLLGSGHGPQSIEWMGAAVKEGWASFVAADIWGYHTKNSNPRGWLSQWYGNTAIDTETGDSFVSLRWAKDHCGYSDLGIGNETDWMRHFWDYHTNNRSYDPKSRPSHSRLLEQIADSFPWDKKTVYDDIKDAIGNWDTRWVYFGQDSVNGVDLVP